MKSIDDLKREKRLRWFGHVERSDDDSLISKCRKLPKVEVRASWVDQTSPKSWKEVLKNYFSVRGVCYHGLRTMIDGGLPAKQTPL